VAWKRSLKQNGFAYTVRFKIQKKKRKSEKDAEEDTLLMESVKKREDLEEKGKVKNRKIEGEIKREKEMQTVKKTKPIVKKIKLIKIVMMSIYPKKMRSIEIIVIMRRVSQKTQRLKFVILKIQASKNRKQGNQSEEISVKNKS
jgi:hypothetical protein